MLRESAERERAELERKQQAKRDAATAAKEARERADALRNAQRNLDRAIATVKAARANRSGVARADAAWREAKARVIELETGSAPEWATAAVGAEDDSESVADRADDAPPATDD